MEINIKEKLCKRLVLITKIPFFVFIIFYLNVDFLLYEPAFLFYVILFYFCKYWPDDGLLRPTLVANNRIIIK
jgi:hypothetical protein